MKRFFLLSLVISVASVVLVSCANQTGSTAETTRSASLPPGTEPGVSGGGVGGGGGGPAGRPKVQP